MRRGAGRSSTIATAAAVALTLAACGGGSRQDLKEPKGTFHVTVPTASFPTKQALAQHAKLVIEVTNSDQRTIPNVAVTICNVTCHYPAPIGEGTSVKPFAAYLDMPGVASHSRPVWVIDQPPGVCGYSCANGGAGSDFTADANTWAAGSLKPGQTATFTWGVTAVAPGHYTVAWEVSAGIYGKATAVLQDGSAPQGAFAVDIAHSPAQSYVNDVGKIVTSK
jgi:hypothetical protein